MTVSPAAVDAALTRVPPAAAPSPIARLERAAFRLALRAAMRGYALALRAAARAGAPGRCDSQRPQDVLLTAHYRAEGWGRALFGPLARSSACGRLRLVTTAAPPRVEGIEVIVPPRTLQRLCGATAARLCTFVWVALRTRPDIVGGVHLLVNGLVAALAARLAGARSLYVCVGGPNEVAGGGIRSENRLFGRLVSPDPVLERQLLDAARCFDVIVTMGSAARRYFESHGIEARCHVVPAGVDAARYVPSAGSRDIDVIVVARLVPLKRLDIFLEAVGRLASTVPELRAVIIGSGPLRAELEALAGTLRLAGRVSFLEHERDVAPWYRRSKVFLLTSDTEGVSISLLEAMLSGAVPVVSDVGDLGDVITDGTDGFLVAKRSPAAFADRIATVLAQPDRRAAMSRAARAAALQFDTLSISRRWNGVLTS